MLVNSEREMPRAGEHTNQIPLRTDRFFVVNGSWYFVTREELSIGPFHTKDEAIQALSDFIDFVRLADPELLAQFFPNILNNRSDDQHK